MSLVKMKEEFRQMTFYRDIIAEGIVSCYLVMFVTFALVTLNSDLYQISTTHIGLMVGFLIFLLIEAFGHISGGHMNPAVSMAMCLAGRITPLRAVLYTVAQSAGAVVGSAIVLGLTPGSLRSKFGPFLPGPGVTPAEGMVVEMVLTFNLIFTALSTTDAAKRAVRMPSLPAGFAVGTGIMAAGTFTGACMNPVVALGPAAISRNFSHHWIYWIGAYLGAALAVAFLRLSHLADGFGLRNQDAHAQAEPKTTIDGNENGIKLRGNHIDEELVELLKKVLALTDSGSRPGQDEPTTGCQSNK